MGVLSHVNDYLKNNIRVDLSRKNDAIQADGNFNLKFWRNNFLANFTSRFNFFNIMEGTSQKQLSLEYLYKQFHLSFCTSQHQNQAWQNILGNTEFGVSYHVNPNRVIGYSMDVN